MKKKIGIVSVVIGSVCILCALALYFNSIAREKRAEIKNEYTMVEIKKRVEIEKKTTKSSQIISPEIIVDEEPEHKKADKEMPCIEIDGISYVGYLSIDKLEIELPIASTLDEDTLMYAPCRYVGSVYQNNLVIGAHNYLKNFGQLSKLRKGDTVVVTDTHGNTFNYSVEITEKLSPKNVEEMINSDYDLTLFTCTAGGKFRIAVRCNEDSNGFIES